MLSRKAVGVDFVVSSRSIVPQRTGSAESEEANRKPVDFRFKLRGTATAVHSESDCLKNRPSSGILPASATRAGSLF